LREAADGIESNTHFLACLDASSRGTAVFPLFEDVDPDFISHVGDSVRIAAPDFYFVLKGFRFIGDRIDWHDSDPMWANEVFDTEPGTVGVLLLNAMRFDFHVIGTDSIHVRVTVAGNQRGLIDGRTVRLERRTESYRERFLADSVVVLADARTDFHVGGDFRDIRRSLPPSRRGAAIAGCQGESRGMFGQHRRN
jgi:hypothetical protein